MIEIRKTPAFVRTAKKFFKKRPELMKKFGEFLDTFEKNPFDSRLSTHRIYEKNTKHLYSSSLTGSYRILTQIIIKDDIAYLVDIGNHDEVYSRK